MARQLWQVWILATALAGVAAAAAPNVIVLLSDDMGYADLGCYGATDIKTPHIDALAKAGSRFTQFYSSAPVCSPSRASLLTGRNHHRAGVPSNVSSAPNRPGMPTGEITFAELVRPLGYRTGLVGKWHLGTTEECLPNGQGFDDFFGFQSGCLNYYTHIFTYDEPLRHDLWRNREEIREDGKYFTELVAREAVRFLEENRERPFLLYVPFNAPHYPMQAPPEWFKKYAELPADRQAYAALASAMDDAVGRIVKKLDELGLRQKTLVIFTNDNGATIESRAGGGGGSNAPFRGHKFSLFEGGIRVPLIVSWPGTLPEGQVRAPLGINTDVFATIADAVGAALPADRTIDGRSLLAALKDNAPSQHPSLCWQIGSSRAIRRGNWKLVAEAGKGKAPALTWLSDLHADPGESINRADQHPAVVRELLAEHARWADDVGASKPATKAPSGE